MKTPWHLWLVGVVTLIWNGVGAMDYYMTATKNQTYMSGFSPEQLEFFYSFPTWAVAGWAVGVWGGVLGSLLLLLRNKAALWVFVASFMGMLVSSTYTNVIGDVLMSQVVGPSAMIFAGVIMIVGLALVWYSRVMKIAGVLR